MVNTEKSKLKALSDIASIDITLDFDAVLQDILKITCNTMNAHSGTMMLVDEKDNELKLVASCGLPANYIHRIYDIAKNAGIPITSSPSGTVMQTGKYYVVPNIFEESKNKPWCCLGKELGFSAQIFTPMKQGLKTIGLLNIYMAEVHKFTDEEIVFANIAASQASDVVQNAMMCRRLKNNLIELKDYEENLEQKIKESHKKLYESEKYLNMIIDSSFDGIMVFDEHGMFEFGNDSAFGILGWPREELIGQSFMKVIPQDMEEFMLERWKEVQSGMGFPYETKIITKNGEIRYLYVSHAHTEIKGKRKYVVIVKDISEFKRLIFNLKESEAKYRDLFENAEDSMYTHDADGIFLTINNAGLKKLVCSKEEIIGTHISQWLTPESFKYAQETLMAYIYGQTPELPIVLEIICKNGEHRWAEITNRVIKDGHKITEIHGVARDITEKKLLEQKLISSESRYRELFDNADEIMCTFDLGGNFLTMNMAGIKMLGCTKEEVIGTNMLKWLTPESARSAREGIGKLVSGKQRSNPIIYEVVCRDGENRLIEVIGRPIKDNGRITEIHGIARDITEKIRIEKQLEEYHKKLEKSYEELKDSDRIKTEFISNITHELLTPLTSIKGFAELLDDETMGKINKEQKKSLENILRNSNRLIKLIKELLDAGHLEKNILRLQFRSVSLNDILSKSIQDMHPQAKDKQISIIEDIEQLPDIWGDEERLCQTMANLLSNAIKFTPPKGKITVTAGEIRDKVKISIEDTGIGIPPDKLVSIFDRFYQVDGSSRRKYGGVGLGLTLCKSIIEKHHGSIWAESDGNGSTFHIELPKSTPE